VELGPLAEDARCPPPPLRGGRWKTPVTSARRGTGRRPSGGRSGGGGCPNGEEIGMPPSPQGHPAARSNEHKNSYKGIGRNKRMQEKPLKWHGPCSMTGLSELRRKPSRLSTELSSPQRVTREIIALQLQQSISLYQIQIHLVFILHPPGHKPRERADPPYVSNRRAYNIRRHRHS
jgi:hypothetical protein